MKPIAIVALLSLNLFGSWFDFRYLDKAKEAYNDKNYTKAENLYAKVELDEAKFNQADALYRQQKYKEAIELYQSIVKPNLEFKKLHNIGNSYAQINKLDEAIKSYEDALKIKEDKDTRFNLELLKKRKKQQQKKKQDKKEDNKEEKKKDNKKNDKKSDKKDSDKKSQEQKDKEEQKKREAEKKKQEEQKKEEQKKKEEAKKKKQEQKAKMADQNKTQPPISNMEERKWQKMLNQRGVNTLMIPLNKGEKKNEANPW